MADIHYNSKDLMGALVGFSFSINGKAGKMTSKKFQGKNSFESDFDSFEFDDGVLQQLDSDLKKNYQNKKHFDSIKKVNSKEVDQLHCKRIEKNDSVDKNAKYYDLPLFIEDLNESDFFDFCKTETHVPKKKANIHQKDEKEKGVLINHNGTTCLSPILGPKAMHKKSVSSSTPLKPNEMPNADEKLKKSNRKVLGNSPKNSQFDYLEADLFDDWDVDKINKCDTQKDTVTFSQALKLIEEAESAQESVTTTTANESIDMLTGEVVTADVCDLFEQSFHAMKSIIRDSDKEQFSDDSVVIVDDVKVKGKPSAAQKLNFNSKNADCCELDVAEGKEKNFGILSFSSDDDLDFFTQDLLAKWKNNSKCGKSQQGVPNLVNKKPDNVSVPKTFDLNDSNLDVFNVKRRKKVNVIDSDTAEDSPSPKFRRQRKSKIRNQRILQEISVSEFCNLEAEVTEDEVSSDEVEDEDEYERSFLDEESYCTQNCSADMTAKYLQSVKNFGRSGKFKIPATKSYDPKEVLSQAEVNNTDYQIDSFCVNEIEEETKTDLSDLEIAEQILEVDEKKRKKRSQRSRKLK